MSVDRGPRPAIRRVNPLGVPLDVPVVEHRPVGQLWECPHPHCGAAARTYDAKTPWHPCPGKGGVMVPLVHAGTRAAHRLLPREDYTHGDLVHDVRDPRTGALVAAVETVRDDGNDIAVLAPTARATTDDL